MPNNKPELGVFPYYIYVPVFGKKNQGNTLDKSRNPPPGFVQHYLCHTLSLLTSPGGMYQFLKPDFMV